MCGVWFKYDGLRLYATTSLISGKGQGSKWLDDRTDIYTYLIGHIYIPLVIDTTHPIGLVFIMIIIQSEFLWGK